MTNMCSPFIKLKVLGAWLTHLPYRPHHDRPYMGITNDPSLLAYYNLLLLLL